MATDFEPYSHKELLAMLASVDAETVRSRGQLLKDAEIEITKIGNDLKNHKVESWEGEAAESFQNWVNGLGNSTLRLGEYSKTGGTWMVNAAQTITEVKANMPKFDQGAQDNLDAAREYRNDPDSAKIGQEAHSKLSADRTQAVLAMKKLAESYEQSSTQMNAAPIPTFPPAPKDFVPEGAYGSEEISRSGGYTETGYAPREATRSTPNGDPRTDTPGLIDGHQPTNPDPTTPVQPTPRTPDSVPPVVTPDRDVNTDLDTVKTPPPPTQVTPTPPAPNVPHVPGGPPPVGMVPPVTLPPIGSAPPVSKSVPGVPGPLGRTPVNPTGPLVPGLPRGESPLGKIPGMPELAPRDNGISGGRQVNRSGPSTSIPRGTVIGEGPHGQPGRPGTPGYGPGMGGGSFAGGAPAQGAPGAGRRLARESGGVIGGRPAAGTPGQPFTQGGSGLLRGSQAAGPVGAAGGQPRGTRRDEQNGERPDYLVEDEETWQDNRCVGPPVVD
ncbi:WXG100 family type VII secretion target [Streptomyces sp. NPDC048603]|uniref:WXG100 family type VII secretion target n=1 Tax=Streptomyces sp. NPDC048603 TaxID=3365577 RepID=UPI003718944B